MREVAGRRGVSMEASLRQLLTELEEAGRRHDAQEPDHSRKMLNLEPATAHLLSMLVCVIPKCGHFCVKCVMREKREAYE